MEDILEKLLQSLFQFYFEIDLLTLKLNYNLFANTNKYFYIRASVHMAAACRLQISLLLFLEARELIGDYLN